MCYRHEFRSLCFWAAKRSDEAATYDGEAPVRHLIPLPCSMAPTSVPALPGSSTHQLSGRVGGHAGVLTSEDESVIIKPAKAGEVAFYESALPRPEFDALRPFVPEFLGTLHLEGQQAGQTPEGIPIVAPTSEPTGKDACVSTNRCVCHRG
jgi:hypothetical protein